MKNFKKIGALLFLSAYLVIGFVTPTLAANNMTNDVVFTPQISIPGTAFQQGTGVKVGETIGATTSSTLLANYIAAFYKWGLSIVGVLAVLMLMTGGIIWLTSAGDSGKIGNAKKIISGSLFGAFLLVGAYFFLNTINPDLTKLPALEMANIKNIGVNSSGFMDGAEKLAYVCLPEGLTCAQTVPASLNVTLSACQAKLGALPNCDKDFDNVGYHQTTWCCGMNSDTQAVADKGCVGKVNGTACKITDTGELGTGYCSNNKCKQCINFGSACSADYECKGGLLQCGYIEAPGVTVVSNCNSGFCANKPAEEGAPCGNNNLGTCRDYKGIFTCPNNTEAVGGGTDCESGLKCCK